MYIAGTRKCWFLLLILWFAPAISSDESGAASVPIVGDIPVEMVPDLRNDKTSVTVKDRNIVVVPIPMSNPTLGTGLIVGGAYFYEQSEEQKKVQPASYTGAAGVYTSNKSYAAGIGQQNYWDSNNWRFTGVAGYANFRLELRDPVPDNDSSLDWLVKGIFTQASVSRRVVGDWYLGGQLLYLDITQEIALSTTPPDNQDGTEISSIGAGFTIEYDTRDVPTNAYSGSRFTAKAMASKASGDQSTSYKSYFARYRYYYQTKWPVVLAADINGCTKTGEFPLWDTCRLSLRGFPVTDYLGRSSVYAQGEARWRAYKRLGLVAFAGYGYVGESFSDALKDTKVPSYGVGVRFLVLKSKRINMRVDYARSDNSDAWYLAVGEAF